MKLNLFGRQKESDDNDTNGASRQPRPADLPTEVRRPVEGHPFGSRLPNNTFNYGGGMRRVKSANGSRPRRAADTASDKNNSPGMPQKARSHSQEARQSRSALYEVESPPPSEQLPIPQCKNTLLEIARTKSDQTDLRRMYDYATWNMYDRIVSARNKKRLSEADSAEEAAKEASSSSSSSKHNDNGKTSPIESNTAATSCSSSTSSPNQAAIACKESGIIKNTSGHNKTAHIDKKVQASNFNNTTPSASATNSTQAMSSIFSKHQQQATTTNTATNNLLQNKLRSIHKTSSSQGTAATESTSTESEDSSGSRSGCDSPATFPGFMTTRGSSSRRTISQGSEDDHFIFQLEM